MGSAGRHGCSGWMGWARWLEEGLHVSGFPITLIRKPTWVFSAAKLHGDCRKSLWGWGVYRLGRRHCWRPCLGVFRGFAELSLKRWRLADRRKAWRHRKQGGHARPTMTIEKRAQNRARNPGKLRTEFWKFLRGGAVGFVGVVKWSGRIAGLAGVGCQRYSGWGGGKVYRRETA